MSGLIPGLAAGRGLLFGGPLWAVNDEYLKARLDLSGPPSAYPLRTHLHGLIGQLVLGFGTDFGIRLLGGAAARSRRPWSRVAYQVWEPR